LLASQCVCVGEKYLSKVIIACVHSVSICLFTGTCVYVMSVRNSANTASVCNAVSQKTRLLLQFQVIPTGLIPINNFWYKE